MTGESSTKSTGPETPARPAGARVVDARGAWCPGPLMELIAAIQEEDAGSQIEVLSSDQGSRQDIPMWVRKAGHELVKVEEGTEFDRYLIRKTH